MELVDSLLHSDRVFLSIFEEVKRQHPRLDDLFVFLVAKMEFERMKVDEETQNMCPPK